MRLTAADESAGHPLIAGKIHGVRSWSIGVRAGEPRLISTFSDTAWESGGRATEAACGESGRGSHERHIPHANCGCGLYAWHPSAARTAYSLFRGDDEGGCTGIVEAWGRVQLHREGFRARYARPTVLILPRAAVGTGHEATIRRLAAAHRAEVAVVAGAGDLERYCRERDLGLSPAAVGDLLGEEPDPPAEESTGVSTPAKLGSSLAEMVLTGFFGLLALLWYGFLAVASRLGPARDRERLL